MIFDFVLEDVGFVVVVVGVKDYMLCLVVYGVGLCLGIFFFMR